LAKFLLSVASAEQLGIPHVVVDYTGIETSDARALGETIVAARRAYMEDFGFDMPETITLDVKVGAGQNARLWTDGESRAFLRLKSREQLLGRPAQAGVHNLYGMCHELGHVAMYRILKPFDWMSNAAAEAWAHYAGSVVVDRVFEWKGETLWPTPYDYREDGMARLQRGLAANRDREAGKWLELEAIVGRKGFRDVFTRWAKADPDPMHPSESLLTALETGVGSQAKPLHDWWASATPLLLRPVRLSPIPAVAIAADSLSGKPIVLALDDGTSDGKYSRDVSAHGRKFSIAGPGDWYLRAISVYAERYGGVEPPDKKVDIALCDSEMRPIVIWQKPYATFPKRAMEWVRLEVPPTKVPSVFYIALYFAAQRFRPNIRCNRQQHDGQFRREQTGGAAGGLR
jgi:hypothetical protein